MPRPFSFVTRIAAGRASKNAFIWSSFVDLVSRAEMSREVTREKFKIDGSEAKVEGGI